MVKKYSLIYWFVVGLFITANVYRGYHKDWNYADPIDLRGIWIGSQLMDSAADFYSSSKGKSIWFQAKKTENFTSNSDFGDQWVSIAVYPPQAFSLFYFIGEMEWKTARIVWWIICGLSLTLLCFLTVKWTNEIWPIGLVLASSATFFALALGQPMLIVLALIALAVLIHDKKPVLAGVLLGVALFKYSLCLPFLFYFLGLRKWTVLVSCAATAIALILPVLVLNPGVISDYFNQIDMYYAMVHQIDPNNVYTFSNSELVGVFNYFFGWQPNQHKWAVFVSMLVAFSWLAWLLYKAKISNGVAMLGLLLISFLFSYHLSYDILLFIIPMILIQNWNWRLVILLFFFVKSLPLNAVFADFPLIKFNYPFLILIGLILYAYALSRNRETPT